MADIFSSPKLIVNQHVFVNKQNKNQLIFYIILVLLLELLAVVNNRWF